MADLGSDCPSPNQSWIQPYYKGNNLQTCRMPCLPECLKIAWCGQQGHLGWYISEKETDLRERVSDLPTQLESTVAIKPQSSAFSSLLLYYVASPKRTPPVGWPKDWWQSGPRTLCHGSMTRYGASARVEISVLLASLKRSCYANKLSAELNSMLSDAIDLHWHKLSNSGPSLCPAALVLMAVQHKARPNAGPSRASGARRLCCNRGWSRK